MSDSETPTEATAQIRPGREMKKIREQAGITLAYISERTLISEARLQALENDDYENVGSATYVTGYARAYAKVVGFDVSRHVAALEQAIGFQREQVIAPSDNWDKPDKASQWQPLALKAGAAVLALLVVVLLISFFIGDDKKVEPTAAQVGEANVVVPDTTADIDTLDLSLDEVGEDSIPLAVNPRSTPITESLGITEAIEDSGPGDEINELNIGNTSSFSESFTSEPEVVSDASERSELVLQFSDECWLRVIDAEGNRLADTIKNNGDTLTLSGVAPFYIKLGNSRAVAVAFNGEDVPVTPRPGYRTLEFSVGE